MDFFVQGFTSLLTLLYSIFGNLGVTIIVFTILIRLVLLPLTLPSIKSSKKMQELQPEIKKLKEKHKNDKQAMALAQAQLFKSYNINPLAGCLPQLIQLFILIVLYQSIMHLFDNQNGFNLQFLWVDLSQFDQSYVLPILAGLTQFILSLMILPATQTRDIVPNDSKSKTTQEANRKEEDIAEMAVTMQQQMVFLMPIMTTFIALKLPSGLSLYWVVGTIITVVTQYFVSGWGGLATYWNKYIASVKTLSFLKMKEDASKKLTLIPKKIHIKSTGVFGSKQSSSSLAEALKQGGGSNQALKIKNKRATRPKKKRRK